MNGRVAGVIAAGVGAACGVAAAEICERSASQALLHVYSMHNAALMIPCNRKIVVFMLVQAGSGSTCATTSEHLLTRYRHRQGCHLLDIVTGRGVTY